MPSGVERAIVSGQLTADAEAWYEQLGLWVSITRHPAMVHLLSLVQLPSIPAPRRSEPVQSQDLDLELDLPGDLQPEPVCESSDPAQLPLIPLDDLDQYHEFTQFLKRSSAAEERRLTVRSSGPIRVRGPAKVIVAGARELREGQRRLRRLFARYQVPGWAAMLTLTLLGTLSIGLFFLGRAAGSKEFPLPVTVTNALSANARVADSAISVAAMAAPNPLAGEERELETNLRIAEAVVWQPAIDFTPDLIWRSARKVDAVRNSISLYRIGAWRVIDSAARDSSPLLESYEEIVRVNQVLDLVQSAVTLLDSLITSFRVNGEVLVFSDPVSAGRYTWLRGRADSLLRAPIPTDSLRMDRAPRRVVARLLETLPTAVVH